MKTIKIQINRLGAVCNSVVELKPLMIFSGESGMGKSYVAILVHYFYKVLTENRLQAFFSARGWDYDTLVSKNPEEASFSFTTPMLRDWITEEAKSYMREALGNPDMEIDVEFEIPFSRDSYTFYNPQNEMFARFQTKRSIPQNETSSQLPRKNLFSSLT